MKAIMLMFDSLNRRYLPPYGNAWVHAPNFQRLAEHTVNFNNCWGGSEPTMPSRRELHTGRHNFLHRSWGLLEPFDDSMPEMLKNHGIYTHIITDQYHYWQDGGGTYQTRYNSWEIARGQERDPWKCIVKDPDIPAMADANRKQHDCDINRMLVTSRDEYPQNQIFNLAFEFLNTNHDQNNWFLQIESFDPHEPFTCPEKYSKPYKSGYKGPLFDNPNCGPVRESPDLVEHARKQYAALLTMCDENLGRILDLMDKYDLWKDTLLIVNTDHGYCLGEHGWWAKSVFPFYNEVLHLPLFIWDPRSRKKGVESNAIVQMIDYAPTLLEYFGLDIPDDMQGISLKDVVKLKGGTRDACIFGIHGGNINVTDGRYVYMRAPAKPENMPLYNYTYMPTRLRGFFPVEQLHTVELIDPLPFTKDCRIMRFQADDLGANHHRFGNLLFDIQNDYAQENPLKDAALEKTMIEKLVEVMKRSDAPPEQFERLGLNI
jgi:arylsulfatase A-like enzyme